MSFGDALKGIRISRKLSQQEFADLLHTSKQVISRYERGERVPKLSTVAAYAAILGLPISDLSGEDIDAHSEIVQYPQGDATKISTFQRAELKDIAHDSAQCFHVSDADIRFALSNGDQPITDAQFEEVKQFVAFIKARDKK